jgi:predicted HD phosphohydrolase
VRHAPGYEDSLSADSKRSLKLQGGVFSSPQAAEFIARPGAEAVRLREWDDLAKVGNLATPPLAHFLERARRCALRAG